LNTRSTSSANNDVEESKVPSDKVIAEVITVVSGSAAQASVAISSSSIVPSSSTTPVTAIAASLPKFYKPGTGSIFGRYCCSNYPIFLFDP
jgi:hypothetical protein